MGNSNSNPSNHENVSKTNQTLTPDQYKQLLKNNSKNKQTNSMDNKQKMQNSYQSNKNQLNKDHFRGSYQNNNTINNDYINNAMREKKEVKTNMNNDLYNRYTYGNNIDNDIGNRISFYSTCNQDDLQENDFTSIKQNQQNIFNERTIPETNKKENYINNDKIYKYNSRNDNYNSSYEYNDRVMPKFNKKPTFDSNTINEFNEQRKTENNMYSKCYVNEQTYKNNSEQIKNNIDLIKSESPYDILDVDENISLKDLNNVYKKIVLKYHPDRPGGNQIYFDKYTNAYKKIQKNIKANSYKDHNELKSNNEEFNFSKNQDIMDKNKFNPKKFNKVYENNRILDAFDAGYGNWKTEERPDPVKINNFTQENFNKKFNETTKAKKDNQIQRLYNLDNNISSSMNYTELGKNVIEDFSGKTNNIEYTDYKKAHTTERLIDPNDVVVNSYKNLNDLEKARSSLQYTMNDTDKEFYQNQQKVAQILEQRRLKNLRNNDNNITKKYKEINKLMINN